MLILFNDEHSLKAYWPIEVTEKGIVMLSNFLHPSKVLELIDFRLEGQSKVTLDNEVHIRKVPLYIVSINEGIVN